MSVSTAGAMDGTRAMNALIDDSTSIYVGYRNPKAETSYKAFFRFDPNSISMSDGDTFNIFNGFNAGGKQTINLRLRRSPGVYQMQARVTNNADAWTDSGWYNISDIPHRVDLTWKAADSGKTNGYLLLTIDGALLGNLSGVANANQQVSEVRLGAVKGMDSGTRGTLVFDNFLSSRQVGTGDSQLTPVPTDKPATPTLTPVPTQTPIPGDGQWTSFFSDSFELGDLSAWTSSVTDGGDLTVSATGAMDGSRALNAKVNDSNPIYVRSQNPGAETSYQAFFRFDPNSILMENGDIFNLFNGINASGQLTVNIRIRRDPGVYQMQAKVTDNKGNWQTSSWYNISDIPHQVELSWRASDPHMGNGYLLLTIDKALLGNLTGIGNAKQTISEVRLGAVKGMDSGTRGTIIFDNYIASRIAK